MAQHSSTTSTVGDFGALNFPLWHLLTLNSSIVQNKAISNGTVNGTYLNFDTLGIGNPIIDEYIQAPYYPEFAGR